MRTYSLLASAALTAVALAAGTASADMLSAYLPDGVPGFDAAPGVTVASRLHPELMPIGLREGSLQLWPTLNESFGFTTNVLPGPYRRGSWQIATEPALTLASDWSRDAFGAAVSARDMRYLALPGQDRTDATGSAGLRLDLGDGQMTLGVAHLSLHEDRGQIDTLPSDAPIAFQVDDVRAAYTSNSGRWGLTPSLEAASWSYAPTTFGGVSTGQAYRDRIITQGSLTLEYETSPLRKLLLVFRGLGQDYTRTPAGQTSPDSLTYQILAGARDEADPMWHWRFLLGGEGRRFGAAIYQEQNTIIAEAGVSWSPTGLTSLGLIVSRDTQDAAQEGVSGLTLTSARLSIDHEWRRDILIKAYAGAQRADFFQGGSQTGADAGVTIVRALNRRIRVSISYDQTDLHAPHGRTQDGATGFSRGLALLTMRLAL